MKLTCRMVVLVMLVGSCLQSCSSISRGVTEALLYGSEDAEDTRACAVKGEAFGGIEASMRYHEEQRINPKSGQPVGTTKILMVHGIGEHLPGFSSRLAQNLTRELKLTVVHEKFKTVHIHHPASRKIRSANSPFGAI